MKIKKPSIYAHMPVTWNKWAEIRTSPLHIYGWPSYRPAAAQYTVCKTLVTCIYVKIWNSNPVPYAHCGVIFGNMCHGFLIRGVSVPEWPAVWRWVWWWMGGHRKGWIESEKLLTRGGGSQTWQGELGYCGSHFHNVHHCSNWVQTYQLSVLMIAIFI